MIFIRLANINDSNDILLWRNDDYTRKMSKTDHAVSLKEHDSWFKSSLASTHSHIYIGELSGEKVGMCKFVYDPTSNTAEVSINLNPAMRGKKLSDKFLLAAINQHLEQNHVTLKATVKLVNEASLKCFTRCNFKQLRTDEIYAYFIRHYVQ